MNIAHTNSMLVCLAGLAVAGPGVNHARADITGFPIPEWKVNKWDSAAAGPVNPPKSITLTTGTSNQSRSMFFEPEKQNITEFLATFTYQFTGTSPGPMGAAFVLHNMPLGASTVAKGEWSGVKTNFGYTDGTGTFQGPSIAVTLESSYLGSGSSSSGVYSSGSFGGGSPSTGPVNLFSGNLIDVTIQYQNKLLAFTATDTVTGASYAAGLVQIDIPAIVGSDVAMVGFTGSTNNNAGTSQTFSNFSFTAVPSPASGSLLVMAGLMASRRQRA